MTQIHLQDWQATLVKHMGALSRSTDPMVEIGLLLCEFSDYMQAEYCAIVTTAQNGLHVIADTDPHRRHELDQFDLTALWAGEMLLQESAPSIFCPAKGFWVHVLEQVGSHRLPLILVLKTIVSIDDTKKHAVVATGGLIKLAQSYLLEQQRRQTLPVWQTVPEEDDTASQSEHVHDAAYLENAIEKLTAAQSLSVQLVNEIMTVPTAMLDQTIQSALSRMGQFCGSDRTYLFQEVSDHLISNTHEWCAPGIEPAMHLLQNQPREIAAAWYEAFENSAHIYISDVAILPDGDDVGDLLKMQGIQSLLAVPLRANRRTFGFVGYDAVRQKRSFMKGEIALIRFVANVIATALVQRNVEERLFQSRKEQDLQRQRLEATLNVIPDIVLELDGEFKIISYHANPTIPRQLDLETLIGLTVTRDFPEEICAVAMQVITDLQEEEVVEGYSFSLAANDQTRHYALSVARSSHSIDETAPRYIAVVRDITEISEQRRQIERFSKIAQTTMNLVIVTDPQGRIEWVNPAFEARTGYQLSEVLGKTPGSVLQSPETDQKVVALIRQALSKLQPITCELLNTSKTGAKYWVRMTIQPIYNEQGQHVGFMALQTDVTASRLHVHEMQQALTSEHAARMQLKSAVDNMSDALIMFDKDGHLVTCNDQYRALYPELDKFLVPQQDFKTLLLEGVREGVFNTNSLDVDTWLDQQTKKFQLRHSQHRIRKLGGRWYREAQKPTPDGGRICILSDITELKDAEQRALADRARAMDASRDGIALVSADGRISYMNPAAVNIMQQETAVDMLGQNWLSLLLGADAEMQRPQVTKLITEKGFWEGNAHICVATGERVEIEISATLNADLSVLCIFRDITEKRQNEVEREALREELTLARRREEIGHIAAGLTHDFNNLLSVISGAASLIQEEREIQSARSMATKIMEASDQAAGLLRRMLALGKNNPVREVIDLCRPVRDAEALVRTGLRAPIKLTVDLPTDPVMTQADGTAIVQMVMNLIINARDALLSHPPEQGPSLIHLSVAPADVSDLHDTYNIGAVDPNRSYACLTVRDTGPGMSKEVRDNIFTPYFSTKGDKGSGLGVPIVVNAVREQGGALSLQSELGQGTCFKILWPIETTLTDAPVPDDSPWADRTILAFASQHDSLDQLTEQLEIAGAMVVPCSSIDDVVVLLADDDSWSAVILAVGDLGTIQAAEQIIRAQPQNAPPIVLIADPSLQAQLFSYPTSCAGPLDRDGLLDDLLKALQMVG